MAVLFLQGPMGPFFKKLILSLKEQNITAHKINFNAGDAWYSKGINATNYSGKPNQWAEFLTVFINENSISSICVYGDCRFYHRVAHEVCNQLNIKFYAFEEGYIRPNHITFEQDGVNGYSKICEEGLANWVDKQRDAEVHTGGTLLNRVRYCSVYYNVAWLRQKQFPHYIHHRDFSPINEAYAWLKASYRFYKYRWTERNILPTILKQYKKKFFLVPLQVFNDAQITFHSPYDNIESFIAELIESFSKNAKAHDILVFKHHPMDRGHSNYKKVIDELMNKHQLKGRIIYCHDQHLPTLLDFTKGVININSTTALSAFHHHASIKVMGEAFYDIKGLCTVQSLAEFWQKPSRLDYELFLRFRNYLAHHGQVNGSYYNKHDISVNNTISEMKRNGMIQ